MKELRNKAVRCSAVDVSFVKDENIAINAIYACNKRDTARLTEEKWLELQDWRTVCCYKDCGYWEQTLPSVYQHFSFSTVDRYCVSELPASSSPNKPRINKKLSPFAKRQANFWKDTARFLAAIGGFLQLRPLNSGTVSHTRSLKCSFQCCPPLRAYIFQVRVWGFPANILYESLISIYVACNSTFTFRRNIVLWPAVSAHFLNKGIGNEQNSLKNSIFHCTVYQKHLCYLFVVG